MPEPLVLQILREFDAGLRARESSQWREMLRRWQRVEDDLQAQIVRLAEAATDLHAAGEGVPAWRLRELDRYRALLAAVEAEIEQYDRWVAAQVAGQQYEYGLAGLQAAEEAITGSYATWGRVAASFRVLPVEAVEAMVGLTSAGSPLEALLATNFPRVARRISDVLVRNTALGRNPRVTARELTRALGLPAQRALTIARTEQLRVYREVLRRQYAASGLVKRYRRLAARQTRTCLACLFADGRYYTVEAEFDEHVNGRCSLVPVVEGLPVVEWQTGQTWFLAQSRATQQTMLGPAAYAAWSQGRLALDDFVTVHHSADWGDSLQVATLSELGLR